MSYTERILQMCNTSLNKTILSDVSIQHTNSFNLVVVMRNITFTVHTKIKDVEPLKIFLCYTITLIVQYKNKKIFSYFVPSLSFRSFS